jgi:hypothetical protein
MSLVGTGNGGAFGSAKPVPTAPAAPASPAVVAAASSTDVTKVAAPTGEALSTAPVLTDKISTAPDKADKIGAAVKFYWPRTAKGGKYHCTIDFLLDWLGLVCFANKNKNCQLSYIRFQTSQTGGQQYSDTLGHVI